MLVSDLLKLLLKIRAKETGVAARLIARSDDLEALAAGVRKNLNILSGWRYEQFGKDAVDLVEGRLAFAIENGKLKMSRVVTRRRRPSMRKVALLAPALLAACSTVPAAATGPRRNAGLHLPQRGPRSVRGSPGHDRARRGDARGVRIADAALGAASAHDAHHGVQRRAA